MKQLFILIIATAGTLLLAMMMKDQGAPLITCNTPQGILNLEFAATPTAANDVVSEWQAQPCNNGSTLVATAVANTKLDFVFIAFYVLFFYMTSLILGQSLAGLAGKLGLWLRWGSVLAGVLDVVENLFMFKTLQGNITSMGTYATAICAKIKFGLVGVCFLYLLLGLGWLVFNRKTKLVIHV